MKLNSILKSYYHQTNLQRRDSSYFVDAGGSDFPHDVVTSSILMAASDITIVKHIEQIKQGKIAQTVQLQS